MPFSEASTPPSVVGIDAGATLWKTACVVGNKIVTHVFPAGELDALRRHISAYRPRTVVATGGGGNGVARDLAQPATETDEFGAWTRGAAALARDEGRRLPDRYLLVSIGTGTSVLLASGEGSRRVGGSALGGGTLMGLGSLLLGASHFEEITRLAREGDRRAVDLLVGDIYRDGVSPLPPDLNASSFAKLGSRTPPDLAHALVGLIGENVGLICNHLAELHDTNTIVYCGSTLSENPVLRDVLRGVSAAARRDPVFLTRGAFCGALGAALTHAPRAGATTG